VCAARPQGQHSRADGLRKPVPAMALRKYWTEQIQEWAHDKRTTRVGSEKLNLDVDKFVFASAIIGLLDNMRADGALRGPRGFWSLEQLTGFMGLKHSNNTAMTILKLLEHTGDLIVVPRYNELGHRQVSERYLRIPPRNA
jgi:hypothetical protein